MITVERDEVFVPCISGMQHLAVSGRNEIIAIRMGEERRNESCVRCFDWRNLADVKVAAPLNRNAQQSNSSRHKQLGQSNARYVPANKVSCIAAGRLWLSRSH
jgi:hypothetical protein